MRKSLLIALGLALAVRIILIMAFHTYERPVTWEYEDIANNILHGKGFVYDSFLGTPYKSLTTPLYIYLCVIVYALTHHSYFAVLLIQSLMSLCLATVIFGIARRTFGEEVAFLSAVFTVFHPGYVYYDVFNLIPLSIDALLISGAVLLVMKAKDGPAVFSMACAGCVIGLGALSRGIIGALLPFMSLYLLFFTGHRVREKAKYIFVLWVAACIVISPWVLRNYMVHKEFVYISSTSGENLYRGNNPVALGTSLIAKGRDVRELWPKEVSDTLATLDELGQKKFFEREAKQFIMKNPAAFIKLYFRKIYYFWWFSHQSGAIYPKSYLMIYRILYAPLLAFALFGAAAAALYGRQGVRDNAWLIVFAIMAVCLTQSLFYVEGRHRWLVEPLVLIFCSSGIAKVYAFAAGKIEPFMRGRHS